MPETPIRFQSPSEFLDLPGFSTALACGRDDLRRLVGVYEWDEPRAQLCGLNGCGTKHWHGYVIETLDGRKTLIGQDCGLREFGLIFREFEASLTRALDDAARAENVAAMLAERQPMLDAATAVARNVEAAAAEVKGLLTILAKEPALRDALDEVLRNGGQIRAAVEANRNTRAAMGQSTAKVDLQTIGVIAGGEVVSQYVSALALLRAATIEPLKELSEAGLAGLSGKALQAKSRQVSDARDGLRRAEAFVVACGKFLAPANLQEFAKLGELLRPSLRNSRTARILRRFAGDEREAA